MRLLHLEDNPADADLVQRHLARNAPEIRVTHAATLTTARETLSGGGVFDAALVDLGLPDGSGFDFLTWVRDQALPMAVVVLTGSGDQRSAIAALQAGADDYLVKGSATRESLVPTLRDACRRFETTRARRSEPLRVLYAEHNAYDVDLTRRHLARHAPHIHLTVVPDAPSVGERLPADRRTPAEFDVVLLDYRLPGLDALELVKELRAGRGLDIPIVMVSGQGSEEVAARAIHLGVDDYVAKHAGYLHELPATLEKVLRQVQLARERSSLRAASERLEHVLSTSPVILYALRLERGTTRPTWVSSNVETVMGYTETEALDPDWWRGHIHPEDRERALSRVAELGATGRITQDYRFIKGDGETCWVRDELRLQRGEEGGALEVIGTWYDITEAKLAEQLKETRTAVLDGLVANRPLPVILGEIATRLEGIHREMRVAIAVRDAQSGRLHTAVAPSLPAEYLAALDGLEPALGNASCGSAAATGEVVIVEDIASHPYWTAYAGAAERAGLRACWSIPFRDEAGEVLGTFGIYYGRPRTPRDEELGLIGEFARMAGLAVERNRADAHLRQAAAVFQNTREGLVITDLSPRILGVNPAFTAVTGYTAEEVLGQSPRLLQSGRHGKSFFQAMWNSITQAGHWQGEVWNRRKNGEIYPQWLAISTVRDRDGEPTNYVGVMRDLTQLRDSQAKFDHLAHFDPLTDLPNRLLLMSRLSHALQAAERRGRGVATLYIDLDRFKNVNDSRGHPVGDELLAALGRRLSERLRDEDTLGRLGGDEFLLLVENVRRPEDATVIAEDLLGMLETPFQLPSGYEVYISASIGISLYPQDGNTGTELVQHADVAMYQAKETGRNTYSFYTPALTQAANERLEMDARLRRALNQGEFVLHYQPQVDMESGRIVGCEALVRWNDPEHGLVSPGRFIPLAEETGLIIPLGLWVLEQACAQGLAWRREIAPDLVMSVNLSARQLRQAEVVSSVNDALDHCGLPPEALKLELTESMIMEQGEGAVAVMRDLREHGVRLSIDDFGTGYSSLAYLKRFPIDELKIDQGFVRDIPHDPNDMEIAAAIIGMAKGLRLSVVGEGVETEAQRDFLARQGCHAYQGYLFSRPLPAEAFQRLLQEGQGELART